MEPSSRPGAGQEQGGGDQASGDINHVPSCDSLPTEKFDSTVTYDVDLSQRVQRSHGIKGRGKVSLILSKLNTGTYVVVQSKAVFVDRFLQAKCVLKHKETSEITCYEFIHRFPENADITNVTSKIKNKHMKIYFDKLTDFSLTSIWY